MALKVFLALLGFGMLLSFFVPSTPNQDTKSVEQQRSAPNTPQQPGKGKDAGGKSKRDTQLQMAGAGALALKNAMKDPESFELKSLVVKANGAACYNYRAKNSFGANLPGYAVLSTKGKLLSKDNDGSAFIAVWNKECTPAGGDEIADLVKRLGIL